MRVLGLIFIATLTCTSAMANNYIMKKKDIRQKLISCLNNPENYNSASFNGCVAEAGKRFMQAADIKMNRRIQQETVPTIRQGWVRDRQIHIQAIKACESQTALNYQGYAYAAQCELKRSQDYYRYSMSDEMPDNDWTTSQRVDTLFISY